MEKGTIVQDTKRGVARAVRAALTPLAITLLSMPAGCVGPESEQCSWGEVCPEDQICHEPTQSCWLPAQIVACNELADHAECDYPGAPADTVCRSGVCVQPRCGDGIREGNEACDDGNGDNTDDCPDGVGGTCSSASCGDGFVWCYGAGLMASPA